MAVLTERPGLMLGEGWDGFRLLDSGHGRKLEAYGDYRFIRPEPQAMWTPRLAQWDAHGEFVPASDEDGGGRWQFDGRVPRDGWTLEWNDIRFNAQCTPFRHLGFFPDMAPVWEWMDAQLDGLPDPQTLNLFGYTGIGSLSLARRGRVTHVDASKKSVAQARENAALSAMENKPVRWLIDDAAKFAAREVRRERRYDGIILDPPKFGRGPNGEVWRIEDGLPGLVADCRQLVDGNSRFLFLTAYAVRMSSLSLAGLVAEHFGDLPGKIEHGDLAVREDGGAHGAGRILPTAIYARWSNEG
ncbi:class I SAM-dependent methyltransferase [Croceicoccus hydrothermalis]|uniref:class I SAM-dependent methyltransferase n=1 Tax=Croceicoccus hydrothermalis TaxID=2867964 RepID=UPI001EFBE232|nr:class I SAM-dependent methyltransferase [Croceicoccus hydrothermalis]